MGDVQYDDSAFYLLVVSLILFYLIPTTCYYVNRECTLPEVSEFKSKDAKEKQDERRRGRFKETGFIVFVLMWICFVYLVSINASMEQIVAKPKFDPYEILGIPSEASPKAIKKAYRKLSIKYHPDKNPGDAEACTNQTSAKYDPELPHCLAAAKFIEISKAEKALTDKETKANYEKYGDPDGPQPFEYAIGLPAFFMEKRYWNTILMVYFGAIVILLPVMVGSWWTSSKELVGDHKVQLQSVWHFSFTVKETTLVRGMQPVLACCKEFGFNVKIAGTDSADIYNILRDPALAEVNEKYKLDKPGAKWLPYPPNQVPVAVEYIVQKEGNLRKAFVLLSAWMGQVDLKGVAPVTHLALQKDIDYMLESGPRLLHTLMQEICGSQRWLRPAIASLELCQCLVQQQQPGAGNWKNGLLQLPGFSPKEVDYVMSKKHGVRKETALKQFMEMPQEKRAEILGNFTPDQLQAVEDACKRLPLFDVRMEVVVEGDDETVAFEILNECEARDRELNNPEDLANKLAASEAAKQAQNDDSDSDEYNSDFEDEEEDESWREKLKLSLPRKEVEKILSKMKIQGTGGTGDKSGKLNDRFPSKKIDEVFRDAMGKEEEYGVIVNAEDPKNPDVMYETFAYKAAEKVLSIHEDDICTVKLHITARSEAEKQAFCPNYPFPKKSIWFAMLGNPDRQGEGQTAIKGNFLINYERVGDVMHLEGGKPGESPVIKLPFQAPKKSAKPYNFEVYLVSDSYAGLDVRIPLPLLVKEKLEMPVEEEPDEFCDSDSDSYSDSESD